MYHTSRSWGSLHRWVSECSLYVTHRTSSGNCDMKQLMCLMKLWASIKCWVVSSLVDNLDIKKHVVMNQDSIPNIILCYDSQTGHSMRFNATMFIHRLQFTDLTRLNNDLFDSESLDLDLWVNHVDRTLLKIHVLFFKKKSEYRS